MKINFGWLCKGLKHTWSWYMVHYKLMMYLSISLTCIACMLLYILLLVYYSKCWPPSKQFGCYRLVAAIIILLGNYYTLTLHHDIVFSCATFGFIFDWISSRELGPLTTLLVELSVHERELPLQYQQESLRKHNMSSRL